MANQDEKGRWLDPKGEPVPAKFVPALDRRRDKMVEAIHKRAERLATQIAAFDRYAREQIDAHLEWAMEHEEAKLNKGGNYTFNGFSGDKRVMIKVAEYLVFDERLQLAKGLIDECLDDWTDESRDELKVLIQDVFQVDKKGRINARRVLSLRKYKFKDQRWKKAMDLLSDSVSAANARAYLMLQQRPQPDAEWQTIRLDLSASARNVER